MSKRNFTEKDIRQIRTRKDVHHHHSLRKCKFRPMRDDCTSTERHKIKNNGNTKAQ